jgi:hypothetical protein
MDWKWFLDKTTERIYYKTGNSLWYEYSKVTQRRSTWQPSFSNIRKVDTLPKIVIPITVFSTGEGFKIDGKGMRDKVLRKEGQTWFKTCRVLHEGRLESLIESTEDQHVIIMSDGFYKPSISAAAWIFTTEKSYRKGNYIYGTGFVNYSKCDSHRAECYGILGGLLTWKKFKRKWRIQGSGTLLICCDNLVAIDFACNSMQYPYITCKIPDFDILQAIRETSKVEMFL